MASRGTANEDGGDYPFHVIRLERFEWEEESRMIEMFAEERGVSLEDPDVVAARRAAEEAEAARVAAEKEQEAQERKLKADAERKARMEAKAAAAGGGGQGDQDAPGAEGAVVPNEAAASEEHAPAGGQTAWMSAVDGEGNTYYYTDAGDTAWELPEGAQLADTGEYDEYEYSYEDFGESGADQWEEAHDEQGYRYWYNPTTGESYYDEQE
eukprot:CAMPEP_0118967254 /NCGR_PEP_ID=MMETSP1173-20130426/4673_1 /TAXON_ID=1034831 /ORGANISM="Rhizochromulina marina cf, Strain CCMP1243" /LENGTH=210 /DNA_ID=CAMNT_0006916195 /DNA_START=18 /DNA_END=651 /DNA_ORIENTATION=+